MSSIGLTRRRLVQGLATLTFGASTIMTTGRVQGANVSSLPREKIGLQLYTVRELMAKNVTDTLGEVSRIGYREVEFAGYFDHEPQQIVDILKANDLSAPSAHVPLEALETDLDQLILAAQTIGHRHLVLPWLAAHQRQSLAQYEAIAKLLNSTGKACKSAGIEIGYHNHDFEFQAIDGRLPYDLLLEQTDPELVKMELDLYWITKAGYRSGDYFDRQPGRFTQCHVKDMSPSGDIADVGKGVIEFDRILGAAQAAGIKHFYVEHDNTPNPLASIKTSYAALRQTK